MKHSPIFTNKFLESRLDLITKKPIFSVKPHGTVWEALRLFVDKGIGSVCITSESGQLLGIFTERDLLKKIVVTGEKLKQIEIQSVMTKDVQTTKINASIARAIFTMSSGGFRHLPIIDLKDQPVGMLSVKDIVDFLYVNLASIIIHRKGTPFINESHAVDFFSSRIKLLMPTSPIKVSSNNCIADIVPRLRASSSGAITICDAEGKFVGIFSERDYLKRVALSLISQDSLGIDELMTGSPVSITENATVADAFKMFSDGGFRHLPIINEASDVIGMLSVKNFIDILSKEIMAELAG